MDDTIPRMVVTQERITQNNYNTTIGKVKEQDRPSSDQNTEHRRPIGPCFMMVIRNL